MQLGGSIGWTGTRMLAMRCSRSWYSGCSGFFGSETARFARFLAAPRRAACHLVQLLRREPDPQVGHNPAGGWMVLLLLALLLAETLTGIYTNNDIADVGPFTELTP